MMGEIGFIKLYRQMQQWEWYKDNNTKALFIHCLLKANIKPGVWKGIHYEAGEFITSLPTLEKETGISQQSLRTSINRLKSTGNLTDKLTDKLTGKKLSKCRILQVNNWDTFQSANRQSNRQTNRQSNSELTGNQQATNRQLTAGEEVKNIYNINNIKNNDDEGLRPDNDLSSFRHLLPLANGNFYGLTSEDVEHLKSLYPNVDVNAQLLAMMGWLNANPDKKKQEADMQRFIHGWLARNAGKAKAAGRTTKTGSNGSEFVGGKKSNGFHNFEQRSDFNFNDYEAEMDRQWAEKNKHLLAE